MDNIASRTRQLGKTHMMIHEVDPELTSKSCPLCINTEDENMTDTVRRQHAKTFKVCGKTKEIVSYTENINRIEITVSCKVMIDDCCDAHRAKNDHYHREKVAIGKNVEIMFRWDDDEVGIDEDDYVVLTEHITIEDIYKGGAPVETLSPTGRSQYPSRPEMQDIPPPGPEHTVYKGGWPSGDH